MHLSPVVTRNAIRMNVWIQCIFQKYRQNSYASFLYFRIWSDRGWVHVGESGKANRVESTFVWRWKPSLLLSVHFGTKVPHNQMVHPLSCFVQATVITFKLHCANETFCMETMCDITRLQCQIFMPMPRERQRTGMKTKSHVEHV